MAGRPHRSRGLPPARTATGWPQSLPDGQRFLFLSTQGQPDTQGVFLGSLDGSEPSRILPDDTQAPFFAAPDTLMVVRKGVLVAMKFDPGSGALRGEAAPLIQPIGVDPSLSLGALSVSDNGVMAHRAAIAERQTSHLDQPQRLRARHRGPLLRRCYCITRTDARRKSSRRLPNDRRETGCLDHRHRARRAQSAHVQAQLSTDFPCGRPTRNTLFSPRNRTEVTISSNRLRMRMRVRNRCSRGQH